MQALKIFVGWADRINAWVGRSVAWLTVLLVVVVGGNVAMRYLVGQSLLALQDLSWYMFGAIFLLGSGYAYRNDRHVRVDVFYCNWSETTKTYVDIAGIVFLLVPFCILAIAMSLDFVAYAFEIGEGSPDPGGLPARYIAKAFIPLGFGLLLLQALAELGRKVLWLRGYALRRRQEGT